MPVGSFQVYAEFLEAQANGLIADMDAVGTSMFMALLGTSYTPNAETHAVWSDVSAFEITGGTYARTALVNRAVTDVAGGYRFSSDTVSFGSNATIANAKWAVIVIGTAGSPQAGDRLLGYFDLDNASGSSVVGATNGAFTLSPSASGWFENKRQ